MSICAFGIIWVYFDFKYIGTLIIFLGSTRYYPTFFIVIIYSTYDRGMTIIPVLIMSELIIPHPIWCNPY